MAVHEISCDLNKDAVLAPPEVVVRVGDADTQTLKVHLYEDGVPYTPTGDLRIQVKRRNGGAMRSKPMTGSGNVWQGTIPTPSYLAHGVSALAYVAEYDGDKSAGTFSDFKLTALPGTTDAKDVRTYDEELNALVTKYAGSGGDMDLAEGRREAAERERETYFEQLKTDVESGEYDGATFTPSVAEDGTLSWTNDQSRPNPKSVNVMGPTGPRGLQGETGERGPKGETGDAAGFGEATATVDQSTGEPSVDVTADGPDTAKVFHFDFHNVKGEVGETGPTGERGPKGDTGEAAGFGEIKATVDQTTGEPAVTVDTDGPDTAKTFTLNFTGIKGETGETGQTGPQGPRGDKGETGDAAGFGEVTATVDQTTGSPTVTVESGGPATARTFAFDFSGIKGEVGETGPEGPRGETGERGPEGPRGETGPKGDVGEGLKLLGVYESEEALREAKPKGERVGDAYMGGESYFVWDGTDWRDAGHLQGAKGDRGEAGPAGPQGPDGPTGPAGRDGAFSEVTVTSDATHLDQPTAEAVLGGEPGAQTLAISFTGLMGPTGPKGADGAPGKDGPQGPAGDDGAPGKDANIASVTATVDATHLDEPTVTATMGGEPGAQTIAFDFKGLMGQTGPQGQTGADGPTGPAGPAGPAGPPGENATTTEVASVEAAGLMPQLSGDSQQVMRGDGTWGEGGGKVDLATEENVGAAEAAVGASTDLLKGTVASFWGATLKLTNVSGTELSDVTVKILNPGEMSWESYPNIESDPKQYLERAVPYDGEEFNGTWSDGEERSAQVDSTSEGFAAYVACYVLVGGELDYVFVRGNGNWDIRYYEPPIPEGLDKCFTLDQAVRLLRAAVATAVSRCISPTGDGSYVVMDDGTTKSIYTLLYENQYDVRSAIGIASTEDDGLMPRLPEDPYAEG